MTINDYVRWQNIPEFVLDSQWHLEISNGPEPSPSYSDYMSDIMLDYAISEITFGQEEVQFEKTSFGLPFVTSMAEYESVTIQYYDYAQSEKGMRFPVTKWFQDWLDTIYDRKKRCIKNEWRKHSKNIRATLTRYFNKNPFVSKITGSVNQGVAILNTTLNPLGIKTGKSISPISTDISDIEIVSYNMENCYISKLQSVTLDDGSGERKAFTANLICEKVTPIFYDKEGNEKE